MPWERQRAAVAPTPDALDRRAGRLLALLAPAIRIEPGLLRAVRLLLGAGADAGTEADVWQHPALAGRASVAATLDPEAASSWREGFDGGSDLGQAVLSRIRDWRGGLPPEVWFEELLCLDPARLPEPLRTADLPAARRFLTDRAPELVDQSPEARAWYRGVHRRAITIRFYRHDDPGLKAAQDRMYAAAFRDHTDPPPPPPDFDPSHIPAAAGTGERTVEVRQLGGRLITAEAGAVPTAGSPLATLGTANGVVTIEAVDNRNAFWKAGTPPPWADDWGRDGFGAWVTFTVTGNAWETVTQRLRWIPPGEAQWEYACRAGTATALYSGDIEILGGRNAPALDPIAWYGGNSGIGEDRVLRGGSWNSSPRVVRAAYRYRSQADIRGNLIGFRCARVEP